MGFRYFFFCVLLFYNSEARSIEVECPSYCICDIMNDYRRATCTNKNIVTVEVGISPLVEFLDLSHNQISELNGQVFSNLQLTELKLMNLSYNKISQIDLYAFEGLEHLKSLDLSYNMIQYFLDQWWMSLSNLRELYLRGNNLESINDQPPINLPHLKVLDLSDNKVENFHPVVFKNLPNLEILDISDNFLISLRAELIKPLTNLQLLVSKGNSLNCEDRTMFLLEQYMKENDVTYVGVCKTEVTTTAVPKFERMMVDDENAVNNAQKDPNLNPKLLKSRTGNSNPLAELKDQTKNHVETAWKQWKSNRGVEEGISEKKKFFKSAKNAWMVDNTEFKKGFIQGNGKPCTVEPPIPEHIKIDSFKSFFKFLAYKIHLASPGGAAAFSGLMGLIIGIYAGQTKTGQKAGRKIKIIIMKLGPILSKFIPYFPNPGSNNGVDGKKGSKKDKNKDKSKKKKKSKEDDEETLTENVDNSEDDEDGGAPESSFEGSDNPSSKLKVKKHISPSVDDRVFLLDDQEAQDGSTPAMKKKKIRTLPDSKGKRGPVLEETDSKQSKMKPFAQKEHPKKKKTFIWEIESEEQESGDSEEKIEKPGPLKPRLHKQPDISVIEQELEKEESDEEKPSGRFG